MSITSFESRPDSVAQTAIEHAAVTEQVALGVARLEGSVASEKAYTLATEIFRGELEKVSAAGEVTILREERLDESGQVRRLKTYPEILGVGDRLGGEMQATIWPTQRSQVEKLKENGLGDPERSLPWTTWCMGKM